MTTITVAWTIFQLLGIIKSCLEGWQWLTDKLKSYKKNKQLVSLDLDAAGMLAIDYLVEKYGADTSFNLIDAYEFNITDNNGIFPNREECLVAHPHNYYVYTFYLAARIIVLSVRSTGEIRELEVFDDISYGLRDKE